MGGEESDKGAGNLREGVEVRRGRVMGEKRGIT